MTMATINAYTRTSTEINVWYCCDICVSPVSLCWQSAHSLGSSGPGHQAAGLQVQTSAPSAALPQQLLDGQRLDDRLTQAQLRGLRAGLAAQLQPQVHRLLALLGDGGQRGRLRGAIAEVGVLQWTDVLSHPEREGWRRVRGRRPRQGAKRPSNWTKFTDRSLTHLLVCVYLKTCGQQSWLWLPISSPTFRMASMHNTWAVWRRTPWGRPICSRRCSTRCFTGHTHKHTQVTAIYHNTILNVLQWETSYILCTDHVDVSKKFRES